MFNLCFMIVVIGVNSSFSVHTASNSTTSCVNQHLILEKNETVRVQISEDEACNFTGVAAGGQGIRIDILKAFSRSIYEYFIVHEIGQDCLNSKYAMTGLQSHPCAMYIACDAIQINIKSLTEFQIQLTSVHVTSATTSKSSPDYFPPDHLNGHELKICENFEACDEVYHIPYTMISYSKLTGRISSLKITFSDIYDFAQDDLPGFDLDTPVYVFLSTFPKCPPGCNCIFCFQWFLADCPDITAIKMTLLIYKTPAFKASPEEMPNDYFFDISSDGSYMYSSYMYSSDIYQPNNASSHIPESTAIDLHKKQLVNIRSYSFTNLMNISLLLLSHNKISDIEPGSFIGLESLHTLDLSYNLLSTIEAGAFSNLSTLRQLSLNDNMLSYISHTFVQGLNVLQVFNLGSNAIENIKLNTFSDIPNLQILSLPNNKLSQVHGLNEKLLLLDLTSNRITDFVIDMPANLTHLSLHKNQLTLLHNSLFYKMRNLKALDLSGNRISVIQSAAVGNLWQLETLYLSGNSFKSLPSDVFRNLSQLQELYLNNTSLESLTSDVFTNLSQLQELYLYNNRLESTIRCIQNSSSIARALPV